MDFFEHQHRARRKTSVLILYFILAVGMIIVAVNLTVLVVISATASIPTPYSDWWQQPYWAWTSLAVLLTITAGTLFTMLKLRGGGRAVAEMVGARRIPVSTEEPDERRLINVVEEMSIASGTPMPSLYVMEDPAINAFVAGYRPTEAVLVVTRGTLQHLNRDELQGVIGHEYSHVLNGDMRINIRLMGILAGILIISQFGRLLMRSNRRGRGKGAGQVALLGLAFFVIGYVGIFFGSLIKAAVSRQRELLADAASVQFTRNPDGIAGALWKIQQHSEGSLLTNRHSDDVSHFCFGEAVKSRLSSLLATHPPLDQRIRAINPRFVGAKYTAAQSATLVTAAGDATAAHRAAGSSGFAGDSGQIVASADQLVAGIGVISEAQYNSAADLHSSIPVVIHDALHQQDGARHIIYCLLLLALDKADQAAAVQIIRRDEGEEIREPLQTLYRSISAFGRDKRLVLLNLAFPALKEMAVEQRHAFVQRVEAIIKSDGRFSLFEFVVLSLLQEHLSTQAEMDVPVRYFKYTDVEAELHTLIALLIQAGSTVAEEKPGLYRRVLSTFLFDQQHAFKPESVSVEALGQALHKLAGLSPLLKRSVLEACTDCVLHDGKVSAAEAELLQLVAERLDCPLPRLEA